MLKSAQLILTTLHYNKSGITFDSNYEMKRAHKCIEGKCDFLLNGYYGGEGGELITLTIVFIDNVTN